MPAVEKASSKIQNVLLAALPENIFGKIVPTTAIICLRYETEEGYKVGVVTCIGDSRMAKRAVAMNPGQAYVMKAKDVENTFRKSVCFIHRYCLPKFLRM